MPAVDKVEPPAHSGKNIAMAKQIYDEEQQQQQQQQQPVKSSGKCKRVEVTLRQLGRPTTTETLIKIDGENDLETLQLHSRQLILNGTGLKAEKKSKTILTKCKAILTTCKANIVVTSNKQYLTYELFADVRRKALDTIKEQRDLLQKINAAEYVITNLLKKQ